MEVSVQTLRQQLLAVRAQPWKDADDYHIVTEVSRAFLARARSSAPTMLIPLLGGGAEISRRGGGFVLTPSSQVSFDYGGRRWEQAAAILECTDIALLEVFLVLVADIAGRLTSVSGELSWSTLLGWVDEWQALLGKRPLMTPEQEMGLWGELWLLSNAVVPDSLVSGWRGPDREAVDFLYDGVGVEVKVSRRAHIHHISQRQVDRPVGMNDAYLLSIWIAPDPIRGIAMSELVEALIAQLADGPAFLKRVALAGYSPLDKDQYAGRYALLEHPSWFRAEDVPRVREIDPGISQIRYLVTLDPEKALDSEGRARLWRHFCHRDPFANDAIE